MILVILQHTPTWVFAILGLLMWLGYQQTRARVISQVRATIFPLAMLALSLSGVATAFGAGLAYSAWVIGLVASTSLILRMAPPSRARFDRTSRTFAVEGSWVPLALMMAIFFAKYAVAVTLATHPRLMHDDVFVASVAIAYGAASGFFLSRGLRLWRISMQAGREHCVPY